MESDLPDVRRAGEDSWIRFIRIDVPDNESGPSPCMEAEALSEGESISLNDNCLSNFHLADEPCISWGSSASSSAFATEFPGDSHGG
jgi:hypothetical protein